MDPWVISKRIQSSNVWRKGKELFEILFVNGLKICGIIFFIKVNKLSLERNRMGGCILIFSNLYENMTFNKSRRSKIGPSMFKRETHFLKDNYISHLNIGTI